MKTHSTICYMADGDGGGGASTGGAGAAAADWRASLPEDMRASPMFATIADVPTLAKGYLNAQTLIGKKRIALPEANALPAEREAFYAQLGRPEAPDKYSEFTVKPAEGMTVDKDAISRMRKVFFDNGLTDAQQKAILDAHFTGLNEAHGKLSTSMQAERATAEQTLRTKWGSNYDVNVNIANAVVKKFADPAAVAELEAGLGNNPAIVELFHKLGKGMLEDKTPGGGNSIQVGTPAAAQARIGELKKDKDFMNSLMDRSSPGHNDAVALWTEVNRQATVNNQNIGAG